VLRVAIGCVRLPLIACSALTWRLETVRSALVTRLELQRLRQK